MCECGCAQPAPIATKTSARYGWVVGQPVRFIQGHHNRLRSRPVRERFWEKVDQRDPGDCWEWQASRYQPSGYGQFDKRGAHRIAWELAVGPIPEGQSILHRCDNPPCVNPAHLFLGTPAVNTADMWAKGRAGGPGQGEQHPNARLTAADIQTIRSRVQNGDTQASLATEFGIGLAHINRIVHRKAWRHVQ